jgi:flagellar hook-associated protein 3 FlgL
MRVNPDRNASMLAALQRTQREEDLALQQLSSGRRVTRPSDDPAAAAVLIGNSAQSAQADQFLRSISSIQAELQTADSTLSSVVGVLTRAISLGVQGANGTLSDSNRASAAEEVQGLQEQLLSLANLNFQGRYVFGGTASGTAPFVLDATQPSGVRYVGNNGVNAVGIGESLQVPVNLPGSQLFTSAASDVFQAINDLIVGLQSNANIDTAVVAVRKAFDQVTAQRVFYGNAIARLQDQHNFLNTQKVQFADQQNKIAGADLAETISRLTDAESARNATLQAAARFGQTSLFDYLK